MSAPPRCEACGASWGPTARWCGRCGEQLAATGGTTRGRVRGERTVLFIAAALGVVVLTTAVLTSSEGPQPGASMTAAQAQATDGDLDDLVVVDPDIPRRPGSAQVSDLQVARCDPDDPSDPCVRWELELPEARRATLAVTRGRVVTVENSGQVNVRAGATGELRWQTDLPPDPAARVLPTVASTLPLLADGTLRFLDVGGGSTIGASEAPHPEDAVSADAWLLTVEGPAIRARAVTGEVAWQRRLAPSERAVLTAGAPYVIAAGQRLTRLFGTTGQDRWQRDLDGLIGRLVASAGGVVVQVAAPRERLVGLDARGTTSWDVPLDGRLHHLVADDRSVAAVVESADSTVLLVLDPRDGLVRGRVPLPGPATATLPPVLTADRVVVTHGGDLPGLSIVGALDGALRERILLRERPIDLRALPPDEVVVLVPSSGTRPPLRSVIVVSVDPPRVRWRTVPASGLEVVGTIPLVVADTDGLRVLDPDA